MAEESTIATSEPVAIRNMEGFVPNSGAQNVANARLRPALYPVTSSGLAYGNPNLGWYAHPAHPAHPALSVENPHFVYQGGGVIGENPNLVRVGGGGGGGASDNPNFDYRVARGIGENPNFAIPNFVNQMGENPNFMHRGGGSFGGSSTSASVSNVGDQGNDEGIDDQSPVKKVKLLCSYGGKIHRRPCDGELRYAGGQTRIISVKRDVTFQELVHKMIDVYGKPVVIKYQLPDGELDALVSVSCSEDLENMMDEYAKLVESSLDGSAKLRVFLFSASDMDSSGLVQFSDVLDSGQRYIDAVNGFPDGVGGGLTRKVSIGSVGSTQNSEGAGGSEGVDSASYGHVEGSGLPSPSMSSPRMGAVVSYETPANLVYVAPNPVAYAPTMQVAPPTVISSLPQSASSFQPESEFKRPLPTMVHSQAPFDHDLQRTSGMDFRSPTAYMQAYVDPYQQLSSQDGYLNPHGVSIAGSSYRYAEPPPQFRDNVVGIARQQFIPVASMSAASLDPHVGMNTNVVQQVMQPPQTRVDPYYGENAFNARVVQFSVDQNSPVYQSQSPTQMPTLPFQAGGSGPVPPPQHVVHSDGRVIHQPGILPEKLPTLEDCLMCQKALPHAHSDPVAKECVSSPVSDANLVFHSAQLEDNLGARPINRAAVSGALSEAEIQGTRCQPQVISQIDHASSDLGRPGSTQGLEVQHDKDRVLQKLDTTDIPGTHFSQGGVDVNSPGVIWPDIPLSRRDDPLQQSAPQLYQVKQEPLVNLRAVSDIPRVDNTSVHNLKPLVPESSTEHPAKYSGLFVKEDPSASCVSYDHLRPFDVREGTQTSTLGAFRSNEQCTSPFYRHKREDVPVNRPQIPGREMFPSNDFVRPGDYPDRNQMMPIGTPTSSSPEVAYLGSSHPIGSNQITRPVVLGTSGPYPHLGMRTQQGTPEELLHGQPALSGADSEYANFKNLSVGERKDEALGLQSRVLPNDALVCPSSAPSGSNISPYGGMFGDNWEHPPPNSLFSNQDPWSMRHQQFPPSETNKEAADEDSFVTREQEFLHKPSGDLHKNSDSGSLGSNKDVSEEYTKQELKAVAEEVLHKSSGHSDKDPNSERIESNKDDYIKQELKAVAEGVAAMVLQPSDMHESSSEASHGRDPGVDVVVPAKVEDVKTKLLDRESAGLPLAEGIGRLQIIKNSDLEELRELGSGTFGTVYHGKWRGSDVAIKRFSDRCFAGKASEKSRMIDDFWNEAIKLADLHHPNVVAFYGVVLDGPGDSVATVTEFMVNGSLRQALQRPLDKRKRLVIAMDVAFGMEYLHGKNIVHFDLKSDNLLVNLRDPHRPICKVGDLGLSKVKCHTLISGGVRGTLPWMAPELLNGSSSLVSEKVDVFSYGIVMWELLTGEEPYADLHYGIIIGGIVSNTLRPTVPDSCEPDWRSLMERCWSSEPLERPSFKEISDQLRSMAASLPPKGQA